MNTIADKVIYSVGFFEYGSDWTVCLTVVLSLSAKSLTKSAYSFSVRTMHTSHNQGILVI